jgi:thioredoxin-like negative regulator of GroEL
MRPFAAVPLAILALLVPGAALAQDALLLFSKGRALVQQGKWSEACPVFAEAHRLQPTAVGISMNLAECYQQIGKTASAWLAFRETEFLCKAASDTERAQYAAQGVAPEDRRAGHARPRRSPG